MSSVYLTSAQGSTGKSTIAFGVLRSLTRRVQRVGVFRPVARATRGSGDYVLEFLQRHATAGIPDADAIGVGYDEVHVDPDAALVRIVERYRAVEARCDAVVIIGSDYTGVTSPTELSFNARVAANLGSPVLLVVGGSGAVGVSDVVAGGIGMGVGAAPLNPEQITQLTELAAAELREQHAALLGIIANRVEESQVEATRLALLRLSGRLASAEGDGAPGANVPVWVLPEDPVLTAPTVSAVIQAVEGELVAGDAALLEREVLGVVIAAMSMENVLRRLIEGAVVIVPADRPEVLLAVVQAHASSAFPSPSAIILNGGFDLSDTVRSLVRGSTTVTGLPIIATSFGTYDTAVRVINTRSRLAADSPRKEERAASLFDRNVNHIELFDALELQAAQVITPLMFEYDLLERAKAARKRIVLPEGDDDRILQAAAIVARRGAAELTILGEPAAVRARAGSLGLDLDGVDIVSPEDGELRHRFAEEFARLRAAKGVSYERAFDTVTDPSYFGTMMVQLGLADGMVSGAAHTTAHTIRPAFEIVKTREGVSVVSSVFFMALADRVLVYGDCAVVPDPSAEQLADIAISSAMTAAQFGIEPRVAMLSYSTGVSGGGADVDKVREATKLVHQRRPELLVDGPLQYDAAADAAVAASKAPGSPVAGRATVFVFPDLNTGNNTYKAVQRSAGAVAIGPVLQGLRKPINDLSRGALVHDIVNTIAITAIQAQGSGVPALRAATV